MSLGNRILLSRRALPIHSSCSQPSSHVPLQLPPKPYTISRPLLQRRLQSSAAYAQQPQQRSRLRRALGFSVKWTMYTSLAFLAGGYVALNFLPNKDALMALFASTPLSPQETLAWTPPPDDPTVVAINARIMNSSIATHMRTVAGMREWRPHVRIPDAIRPTNLTGGTLAGKGRITVPPLVFSDKEGKASVVVFHLGDQLCGHPGIVHGGLLATLLDEGLARCCFDALPNKMAVTANLNINYRRPAMADRFYVLRAKTTKVEGRKAWVEGWIEELEDQTDVLDDRREVKKVVEASALFIEPRNARYMKRLYATSD